MEIIVIIKSYLCCKHKYCISYCKYLICNTNTKNRMMMGLKYFILPKRVSKALSFLRFINVDMLFLCNDGIYLIDFEYVTNYL